MLNNNNKVTPKSFLNKTNIYDLKNQVTIILSKVKKIKIIRKNSQCSIWNVGKQKVLFKENRNEFQEEKDK